MKPHLIFLAGWLLTLPAMAQAAEATAARSPLAEEPALEGTSAVIQLRDDAWLFDTVRPAQSALTAASPQAEFAAPASAGAGFTVKLAADLSVGDGEREILAIPGVLSVRLRQHDPRDRRRQNYPAFRMPDGSVPVLEAKVLLHSAEHPDWKEMTIGCPVAMLKPVEDKHEIVLNFSGVRWSMYVDRALVDNDFPFGDPQWAAKNTWTMDPKYVSTAALYLPALPCRPAPPPLPQVEPVQYWTPPGHNAWVGDVVTFFHRGRYHVLYLYDRRHHQSKFGKGAHYFEHLSTTDLLIWTEHEAATPLEEQWECIGTGTPFVFENKFCLAYGLHTGRIYPPEKTTWPAQWEYLKQHGYTGTFRRDTTPGCPAGSTYSVSADGIAKFHKSQITFHPCQNPSVYTDPEGRLRLLANAGSKGIWESPSIDGGWRCVRADFPPGGDCTFFFRWGRFDYIIGGFKDLWSKPAAAPDSAYADVVKQGLDFYDGLNVPAITAINGGRVLMAGWVPIRGWGGCLVLRELLQLSDGRIGAKWLKEAMPQTGPARTLAASVVDTATFPTDGRSFLLEFTVQPAAAAGGRVAVSLLPEDGADRACELQVDLHQRRAQFASAAANGFAGREKSLREGGAPQSAHNYAIENLIGVDGPCRVRVIVKGSDKLGGSLVDAEIAGQRTMISYRPDLTVERLLLRPEGVVVQQVRLSPLRHDADLPPR